MMTELNINLLPINKKTRLQNLVKFIFSKHILELIILAACLVSMALIWSWLVLQQGFTELASASALVNKEYANYNTEIREINSLINNIDQASADFQPITPKIINFADNLPKNIKINSLYIDRQNKTLTIQGVAKNRDDFINYQETIKKINWIGEVSTPASKLFQKENINFEFKTNLLNFIPLKK